MMQCHGVVIFYGKGGEAWRSTIESELRKTPAEHKRPVSIYLARPMTEDKQELIELKEPFLIDGFHHFPENQFREFLKAVEGRDAPT